MGAVSVEAQSACDKARLIELGAEFVEKSTEAAQHRSRHSIAVPGPDAYGNKNREVVLTTFPDLVRTYFPQWEAIYANITPPEEQAEIASAALDKDVS